MAESMAMWVEVWPVAADAKGIWLISGTDRWKASMPVPSDSEPHWEVERILFDVRERTSFLHSTSWRVDGQAVILTYIAVLDPGTNLVLDIWPQAVPVSPAKLFEVTGTPKAGPATEPPAPRYVDVLMHAIRHIRLLIDTDATARSTLRDTPWIGHLQNYEPALAGMYEDIDDAVGSTEETDNPSDEPEPTDDDGDDDSPEDVVVEGDGDVDDAGRGEK